MNQIIDHKLEELAALRSMTEGMASNIRQDKVMGGAKQSMEDAIIKVVDLSNEINQEVDQLVALRREIMHLIRQVEDWNCRLLLEMRYINRKSWDEIAAYLGCDPRTVFRTHGRALKLIDGLRKSVSKCH